MRSSNVEAPVDLRSGVDRSTEDPSRPQPAVSDRDLTNIRRIGAEIRQLEGQPAILDVRYDNHRGGYEEQEQEPEEAERTTRKMTNEE